MSMRYLRRPSVAESSRWKRFHHGTGNFSVTATTMGTAHQDTLLNLSSDDEVATIRASVHGLVHNSKSGIGWMSNPNILWMGLAIIESAYSVTSLNEEDARRVRRYRAFPFSGSPTYFESKLPVFNLREDEKAVLFWFLEESNTGVDVDCSYAVTGHIKSTARTQ